MKTAEKEDLIDFSEQEESKAGHPPPQQQQTLNSSQPANRLGSEFEANFERFNNLDEGQLEQQLSFMKQNKELMKMNYK